jgi:hypothetical protein
MECFSSLVKLVSQRYLSGIMITVMIAKGEASSDDTSLDRKWIAGERNEPIVKGLLRFI